MKILALCLLLSVWVQAQPAARLLEDPALQVTRTLNHKPIGLSFPPVSSPVEISSTIQHARTLGVKAVRFSENWKLREPAENVWNWAGLDYRIDSLYNAGIKVFLTVESDGPAWRCGVRNARSCVFNDLQAFRGYVDTLVRRYRGKLASVQFGNESYSTYWYAGTALEFVASANAFYEAVKAADPSLRVALSGFQISALHALTVCQVGRSIPSRTPQGVLTTTAAWCADTTAKDMLQRIAVITSGARYDLVDVHLYDNVEYWFDYLEVVRSLLPGKTIVATEIGAPSKRHEPLDDAYHAVRVGRILAMLPLLGLYEAYYFKLVDYPAADNAEHEKSGLLTHPALEQKPAYNIIKLHNTVVPQP